MDGVTGAYPKEIEIHRYIKALYRKTIDILKDKNNELWLKHNAYTTYCVLLEINLTCHRPVRDPFNMVEHIDLDNGLMIINDKAKSKERQFRLIGLPELAVNQMREYKEYLRRLSAEIIKVSHGNRELSAAIYSIDFPGKQKIPQFFYLDSRMRRTFSITSSLINEYTRDIGWFPTNYGRHVAATELMKKPGWAEKVEILLGHDDNLNHPFGAASEKVPWKVLGEIAEENNKIMSALGWGIIPAFLKRNTTTKYNLNSKWFKSIEIHEEKYFGDVYRKKVREKNYRNYSELLRSVFEKSEFTFKDNLAQKDIDKVVATVRKSVEENGLSEKRCLLLFYRLIASASKKYNFKFNVSRSLPIVKDDSPFTSETLKEYGNANKLRKCFIAHCADSAGHEGNIRAERRVAEIVISSALFGYVGDAGRLKDMCEALVERCYYFEGEVFIDLKLYSKYEKEPEKNVFRWYPDNCSIALIAGLYTLPEKELGSIEKRLVERELKVLMKKLDSSYSKGNVWKYLSRLSASSMCIELPGYIREIASGNKKSASIRLRSYVRIMSGRRLARQSRLTESMNMAPFSSKFPAARYAKEGSRKDVYYFLNTMRKIFKRIHNIDHNMHENINTRKKRLLRKYVEEAIGDGSRWSVAANALSSWLINLCTYGTQRETDAAISTIDKYFFMVAKSVMHEAYDKDLLVLDEGEYEDIYSKCLAYNKCKDPQVFPRELREFHRFMVNKWSVEELDWTIIYSAAGLDSAVYIPNANYLREDEYIEIFKAIINDNELSSLRKLQYTVLLLLCYRFGLRFGEAYRMQWKNIQYDEELQEVNVRVKKGFHGNPKTDAGIRKVSLLTKLTRKEKNTLKQLLDIHEPGFNVDPQQGLMADVGAERFLIDRAHASTYISTLMRHVTGDDSIRLHHLRHSWANEACLKDYKFKGNKIPCDSDLVSKYDVNDSVTLRDASVLIGHSDEGTLLGSYIHKTDRLISKYCETISPKIDARSLQYMANIKYDTARQRLYRGKSKRIDFVKILKLSRLIKQPCVELAKSRPCYVSNIDKGSDLVSLGMVNEILLACAGEMMCNSPRSRIDSIAERFLLNSKFVEVILDKAAHVERKSGYDLFGLGQFNRDLIESNVEKKKWGWRANITGEARARVLLHTVGKHYEGLEVKERDILHEAVNIWQEDYFNVDSDLYITELNAIDTFGKAIDLLGFRGLKLGITVPTELAEKCQPLKERFGERFNIRISNIRYAYKKTQWERKSRLRVSAITKNSDIVTKQTFARLMFCLSVWCLLRPIQ